MAEEFVFEGGDESKKSAVSLSEYDRKTVLFVLRHVHEHVSKLVDKDGIRHETTSVGVGILTWDQLLGHVRGAQKRMEKKPVSQEQSEKPVPVKDPCSRCGGPLHTGSFHQKACPKCDRSRFEPCGRCRAPRIDCSC